jgi:hypothetical protein
MQAQLGHLTRDVNKRVRATVHSIGVVTETADPITVGEWFSQVQTTIMPFWEQGEIWKRRDDLCEGDVSLSTQYIDVQFKIASERIGVDHFIYQIPAETVETSVEYLPLLGVIRSTAIGNEADEFSGVTLGDYEYVDDVNEGDIRRVKIVYRFRTDGKLALRYLHQDQAKKWHLDYKVVYENTGNPYIGSRFEKLKCRVCVLTAGARLGTETDLIPYPPHGQIYNRNVNRRPRAYRGLGVVSYVSESTYQETSIPFIAQSPIE